MADILLVAQWRLQRTAKEGENKFLDMCSAWQRVGRGARDRSLSARVIFFVESGYFERDKWEREQERLRKERGRQENQVKRLRKAEEKEAERARRAEEKVRKAIAKSEEKAQKAAERAEEKARKAADKERKAQGKEQSSAKGKKRLAETLPDEPPSPKRRVIESRNTGDIDGQGADAFGGSVEIAVDPSLPYELAPEATEDGELLLQAPTIEAVAEEVEVDSSQRQGHRDAPPPARCSISPEELESR